MIDREKVIKGLESLRDVCNAKADMAIGKGRTAWAGYASVAHLALALLREQEPVRCKDCKHYETNTGRCVKGNTHGYADTWTCGDSEGRRSGDDDKDAANGKDRMEQR